MKAIKRRVPKGPFLKKICLFVGVVFVSIHFGSLKAANNEIQKTWREGLIIVPSTLTVDRRKFTGTVDRFQTENVRLMENTPVVLWFHECAGIGAGSANFFQMAQEAGYAVIAPRSFVRTGREKVCELGRSPKKAKILKFREEEILFAIEQVRGIEGVNRRAIILAGFSEGAAAVRRFRADRNQANGLILLAPWCSDYTGDRINSAKTLHALSILGTRDQYITNTKTGRNCRTSGFRGLSGSFEFEHGHDVTVLPEVRSLVIKHLRAWRLE
ncbi:MAG: hypothetical protein VW771_06050 [Gammaproteobacteria bacterium]